MGQGSRSTVCTAQPRTAATALHCLQLSSPQSCASPPTAPSDPELSDLCFPCNASKQKRKETALKKKRKEISTSLNPIGRHGFIRFPARFHTPWTHQHGMQPPCPNSAAPSSNERAQLRLPLNSSCGFALAAAQRCPQVPRIAAGHPRSPSPLRQHVSSASRLSGCSSEE